MTARSAIAGLVLWLAAMPIAAQSAGLSAEQVKHWIATRIALAHIQREMAANASQYDDLPRAFDLKSRRYLENTGYGVDRYEMHKQRILDAEAALTRRQEHLADIERLENLGAGGDPLANPEFRQVIVNLRAAGLPEAEIQPIIARMHTSPAAARKTREQAAELRAWFDATRRDWDGVRPWITHLDQLTHWYAGNQANPPQLD